MEKKAAHFNVIASGPLEITGDFELVNAAGEVIARKGPVYLCRCGMSSDKPFCDDSHKTSGFPG